jgi:hypothetical protein
MRISGSLWLILLCNLHVEECWESYKDHSWFHVVLCADNGVDAILQTAFFFSALLSWRTILGCYVANWNKTEITIVRLWPSILLKYHIGGLSSYVSSCVMYNINMWGNGVKVTAIHNVSPSLLLLGIMESMQYGGACGMCLLCSPNVTLCVGYDNCLSVAFMPCSLFPGSDM